MMKKILLVAALTMLSGCAVTQSDGVMTAEKRTGGFLGLSAKDAVEVNTGKAFTDRKKVIIGGFKIGFTESKSMTNQASGGVFQRKADGRSTGRVRLEGIDDATRQSIANAAYKSFVSKLEKQGYTVVNRSEFTGSKDYAGGKKYTFPYEADDSGFLSSYGVAHYYSPAALGSEQLVYAGDIPGVSGGFAFGNGGAVTSQFADSTKTPVLHVSYLIDFAGSGGHAGMFTSNLKVGQLLSVDQGNMGIIAGHGGSFSSNIGSLKLGQPIASDKEFATITDTTSATSVGVETTINVASTLFGHGGTNQARNFVFNADAAKYKSASLDALDKAMDLMIEKAASF